MLLMVFVQQYVQSMQAVMAATRQGATMTPAEQPALAAAMFLQCSVAAWVTPVLQHLLLGYF